MKVVRLNIENYLAEKYNIKMYILVCIEGDSRMYKAEWEENTNEGYGNNTGVIEYFDIQDAIFWLEMEVGSKISDILKSEIDKCKEAAYQLNVINVDGFLI